MQSDDTQVQASREWKGVVHHYMEENRLLEDEVERYREELRRTREDLRRSRELCRTLIQDKLSRTNVAIDVAQEEIQAEAHAEAQAHAQADDQADDQAETECQAAETVCQADTVVQAGTEAAQAQSETEPEAAEDAEAQEESSADDDPRLALIQASMTSLTVALTGIEEARQACQVHFPSSVERLERAMALLTEQTDSSHAAAQAFDLVEDAFPPPWMPGISTSVKEKIADAHRFARDVVVLNVALASSHSDRDVFLKDQRWKRGGRDKAGLGLLKS